MRAIGALSTTRNTEAAWGEILRALGEGSEGEAGDLAMVFASPHHADELGRLSQDMIGRGIARHILGCTGESIVGDGREIEGTAALSVWVARMPGVSIAPARLEFDPKGESTGLAGGGAGPILLLADPFTFPTDRWLARLRKESAGTIVMGGMASAGQIPGRNVLILDGEAYDSGAVAARIDGPIRLDAIVSQGCRPIGRPLIVTKSDENRVLELGRRPAVEVLRGIYRDLAPEEQEQVREGLHLGRVIDEYRETFGRGDFLVHNIIGADETGGIAVTERIRVGQTVQFHVRDADTADDDLNTLLETSGSRPFGALLFSCNGRGQRLFPGPHHDVEAIRRRFGTIPVAGFFAMGEIGPIGGQNFVHGYTASIALFSESP
ncbi:MAG: FIST N-terminal domain-containing protein [Isosphaeraceae bacterium]